MTVPNRSETPGSGRAARCAACDSKFGLVRHYSWRTPLCSKKCVGRFRVRRESDRNWMGWLQIVFNQLLENRARLHDDPHPRTRCGKVRLKPPAG